MKHVQNIILIIRLILHARLVLSGAFDVSMKLIVLPAKVGKCCMSRSVWLVVLGVHS